MSLQKVSPDSIETFTVKTRPHRFFSSSSSGVTGSVYVFARRSAREKETRQLPAFVEESRDDSNLDSLVEDMRAYARERTNIQKALEAYLSGVNAQSVSARKNKYLDVLRFVPSVTFSKNTQRKLIVKNVLNPYYRNIHPKAHWAYTNYFSLNFFTASSVPSDAALIYPDDLSKSNSIIIDGQTVQLESGNYVLPDEWSFDFYINPRYAQESADIPFRAGTILHVSSCYAVSLVTGSSKDPKGFSDGFRLMLQLSHSADIRPSQAIPGNWPHNLVFLSDDNSLIRNHWHHVVIRWGGNNINAGTGSFVVDGIERGTFNIPSATVAPRYNNNVDEPAALFVGNYYEGINSGTNSISYFFAADVAEREGLLQLDPTTGYDMPVTSTFRHQLNAELHDVAIKRYYMTDTDIAVSSSVGPIEAKLHKTVFYLPPFFTKNSPTRKFVGTYGGIPQTPFFSVDGTTDDPFNVGMSFGVGGHYMNLENFTYDFASGQWPRLLSLSASEIQGTTSASSANDHLYSFPATGLRNLLILPCDDGAFFPNYDLLENFVGASQKYTDDLGVDDFAWINLDNMVDLQIIKYAVPGDSGSFFTAVAGATPEDPGLEEGVSYAILQRTRDPSSNQVAFFDISNLFYGNRIYPQTLEIKDTALTASRGRVQITLKDDGYGNVYRADAATPNAQWSSVGNIYYNEGIVVVKDPSLYFFGKERFDIDFRGDQNIHVMKINAILGANEFNSSSNPNYMSVSASAYPNDADPNFVYVTGINFHDDNFNVVAKTALVQPIVKRKGERYLLRSRIDF